MNLRNNSFRILTFNSLLVIAPFGAFAQTLFVDTFDGDSTASWTVNPSAGTHPVNIFFDYSSVGIPSAPNSTGGTTRGAKLQANTTGGVFGGVSISPTAQSFTGDYTLRFDSWQNFNGPSPVGGSGSTQVTGAGIGTAGTTAQWAGATTQDSVHFGTTGDGNSSVDYRAYSSAAPAGYLPASGVFAAGTGTSPDSRNHNHPYYVGFGGNVAPAAQVTLFPQQTGTTLVGSQAFEWHDVLITKLGNTLTWDIDGLRIATIDLTTVTLGGNNILFNHYDINAASSTDPNAGSLIFGLIDNVRVEVVPEPATWALGLLGATGLYFASRRRK